MTQHMERHLQAISDYLRRHVCAPALLVVPRHARTPVGDGDGPTKRLYMGQGRDDPRYIMRSTVSGLVTMEQMGCILGVTPGTARDRLHGRRNRKGIVLNGTFFVEHATALNELHERWMKE
jgi:hypothetical protein